MKKDRLKKSLFHSLFVSLLILSPAQVFALNVDQTCGSTSCSVVTLREAERREWAALREDGGDLAAWSLRQMDRAADAYRDARVQAQQLPDPSLRARVEACLSEVRTLSGASVTCLQRIETELGSSQPTLLNSIRAIYYYSNVSTYAQAYCTYYHHTNPSLESHCREYVLTQRGALTELRVHLSASEDEARSDIARAGSASPSGDEGSGSGSTAGTGRRARTSDRGSSASESRSTRSSRSRGSRTRAATSDPSATPSASGTALPGSPDLITSGEPCGSASTACSLSDLRGEGDVTTLLNSGIPGRCLRQNTCRISQFGGGSSPLLNTALNPALLSAIKSVRHPPTCNCSRSPLYFSKSMFS